MRNGKRHLVNLAAIVLAALVIVPATSASGPGLAPDDRALPRATTGPVAVSPDDRAFSRAIPVSSKTIIVSPDDRAFSRGIPVSSKTIIVSPDDRAFVRSTPVQPRAVLTSVSVQPRGFDWGDALIGGTFGLSVALLGAGAVAITLHHRRDVLRTA